jgi:hypothetical protein
MSRAHLLLPLYVFLAQTGTNLPYQIYRGLTPEASSLKTFLELLQQVLRRSATLTR